MRLNNIRSLFRKELAAIYDENEIESFFFILSEHFYGVPRIKLAMEPNYEVGGEEKILEALNDLKKQRPIQYIIGETQFYGLRFHVNDHVLIPRPETEELVDWIVSEYGAGKSEIRILDIGTGSGCIAVSLAKHLPQSKVYGLDVSNEALDVARHNAQLNNVAVEFLNANILEIDTSVFKDLEFDIIVSNPPYVREQEKKLMKANVLDNEPHLALFVKNETPLVFYDAIALFSLRNLKKGGALYFEINEYLGQDMIQLLHDHGFSQIKLKQDLQKKDRMLKGVLD